MLKPIIDGIQPIIDQLQPALDLLDPATAPPQLDFLDPLLAEVDTLLDQALALCAAEAEETAETTTTTLPPTPEPAEVLPRTGADAGAVAGPALAALALAGLLRAARRRLR